LKAVLAKGTAQQRAQQGQHDHHEQQAAEQIERVNYRPPTPHRSTPSFHASSASLEPLRIFSATTLPDGPAAMESVLLRNGAVQFRTRRN